MSDNYSVPCRSCGGKNKYECDVYIKRRTLHMIPALPGFQLATLERYQNHDGKDSNQVVYHMVVAFALVAHDDKKHGNESMDMEAVFWRSGRLSTSDTAYGEDVILPPGVVAWAECTNGRAHISYPGEE